MTKKEQAELEALRFELAKAKALRLTDAVAPDIPAPQGFEPAQNGWLFAQWNDGYRVEKACSSSTSHNFGAWDKPNSQGARRLYSTELLATQAARSEMANRFAEILAKIDREIEVLRGAA